MARKFKTDVVIPAGADIDDLIEGGPGVPAAPAAPAGPQMVEIEIDGAKFLVPSESADAIRAQHEAAAARVTQLSSELEAARQPTPAPAPVTNDEDFDTELFVNPKATLDKFGQQIRDDIRQEYVVEQARAKWWTEFYGSNKHLQGADTIVEAVMSKHFKELEALPLDKQQAALASKVDDELARIVKTRAGEAPPLPTARPVEGGSAVHGGPTAPTDVDDLPADRVISIGEIQRNQRKRRLEARTGRVSA